MFQDYLDQTIRATRLKVPEAEDGGWSFGAVLRDIQTLFDTGTASGLSDRQLLERFASRRDASAEAAFEVLVLRHGPMVLRVCHNVLGDATDAQDAFQATFLVLVRRSGSIRRLESLGSWLYGVACRVAARARVEAARRRAAERRGALRVVQAVDPTEESEPGPCRIRPDHSGGGPAAPGEISRGGGALLLAGIDPGAGRRAAWLSAGDRAQPPGPGTRSSCTGG